MKNVKLKSIVIRNFKGIKVFEGAFDKKQSFIRGENATGKTSINDAISWTIDGKNSAGDSDGKFNIKTLDENNQAIPKLQHSVELTLEDDGMERHFKRVYKEKYTKKRGTEDSEFSGHTTDFFVDGIELTETAYKKKISEIMGISLEEYLMLSNPLYFMNRLDWKKKREILSDLAGEVTYQDIIVAPMFSELDIQLEKYSPEEYKQHCEKTKKAINKQIEAIPHRFDELDKMEGELSKIDYPGIEKKISEIELNIKENEESIKSATDSSAQDSINLEYTQKLNKLKQQKADLETKYLDSAALKNKKVAEGSKDIENDIAQKKDVLFIEKNKLNALTDQRDTVNQSKVKSESELESLNLERDKLRAEGKAILERKFSFDDSITCCPACMRDFSEDDLNNKKEIAEKNFNIQNKKDLDELNKIGKAKAAVIEKIEKDVEIEKNQIKSISKQIALQEEAVSIVSNEIKELEEKLSKVEVDTSEIDKVISGITTEGKAIAEEIINIEEEKKAKLAELDVGGVDELKKGYQESINCFKADIKELEKTLSTKGQLQQIKKGKDSLRAEEKDLSLSWESWARQSYLVDELIKVYVSKIEESVNKKFSLVNFKLFEIQQNGGIKSICQVLLKGVPDGDINTAGVINAGIDIINTLSAHFGVSVPIVIDNRESITEIIKTDSQVINLIKDSAYGVLTQTER